MNISREELSSITLFLLCLSFGFLMFGVALVITGIPQFAFINGFVCGAIALAGGQEGTK